ncbi:MAG: metallophosphoesterase [Pseudomonadota bacterium]
MPDSVRGEQRRAERLATSSGDVAAMLWADEVAGLPLWRRETRDNSLENRVGSLHARYRLSLEAKRQAVEPGIVRDGWGHTGTGLAPIALIARLARLAGLGNATDRRPPRVVHHNLEMRGLPASLEGLTLAHISDLHLDLCAGPRVGALAAAASSEASDALVITGDLFTSALAPARAGAALDALSRVLEQHGGPAFAVLGDEDSLWAVPRLEQIGLRVLVNESVALSYGEDRLYLAGVDDPAYFKADDVEAAQQCIPAGATTVLLAHSPEIYRRAAGACFHAMLCGHTHGGQLCLPNGKPLVHTGRAPFKVSRGSWRHGQMSGYTSAGCGATPLRLRLNCPAEVTFHHLTRLAGEG